MSEGPSEDEVERVREAMQHHDSELREDQQEPEEESEEAAGEQDEDR
jgi:hypothetical protein